MSVLQPNQRSNSRFATSFNEIHRFEKLATILLFLPVSVDANFVFCFCGLLIKALSVERIVEIIQKCIYCSVSIAIFARQNRKRDGS